jgi:hypothetical protein
MYLATRLLKKNYILLPITLELDSNASKCVTLDSSKPN